MASRDKNKGPTNLSAVVSKDSVENVSKLQEAMAKLETTGKKLSRTMEKELKKAIVNNRAEGEVLIKQQRELLSSTDKLSTSQQKHLRTLEKLTSLNKMERTELQKTSNASKIAETSTVSLSRAMQTNFPRMVGAISLATSAISGGLVGALNLALSVVTGLYEVWFRLQTQAVRGMGELARATGVSAAGLANLTGIARGMGETFYELGGAVGGLQEAFAFTREVALGLRDTRLQTQGMADDLLETTHVFGVTAEQGANLFRDLSLGMFGAHQTLDEFGAGMVEFANSIHANSTQIVQQYAGMRSELAHFGRSGDEVFRRAATMAQSYGFEVRTVLDLARGFETFGDASTSVNTLNSILGTTMSSFDLMMEQDPAAVFESIRSQIEASGVAWDDMGNAGRRATAAALHVTEEEAARIFMNHTSLAQLEAERDQAAADEEARQGRRRTDEELMHDMLMQTSTAFRSIGDRIEQLQAIVAEALSPAFSTFHDEIDSLAEDFASWLREAQRTGELEEIVHGVGDGIRFIGTGMREMRGVSDEIARLWDGLSTTVQIAVGGFQNAYSFLTDPLSQSGRDERAERSRRMEALGEHAGEITGAGAAQRGQDSIDSVQGSLRGMGGAQSFTQVVDSFITSHPNMEPAQAATVLSNRLGPEAVSQLERQYGRSLSRFVSSHYDRFRRGEEMSSIPSAPPSAIEQVEVEAESVGTSGEIFSATSTSPATDRTTSAPSSVGTGPSAMTVVPLMGRVEMDGQAVGRFYVEQARQRA